MIKPNCKIIVGMSGGVDSSVAAHLLKQQGYQVSGIFMKNWEAEDDDQYCSAEQDYADAKAVADKLEIPLTSINFSEAYWDKVFQTFLAEYQAGRTPNPDILCNKEIKFKAFLNYALEQGADYIATGHYARIQREGTTKLLKGLDDNKDQSYFLAALNHTQLERSLFPLGEIKKTDVRKIAADLGLVNSAKKDSTGICFIGERRFRTFLQEYLLTQPGDIVTTDGQVIGRHHGLMYYTLGQRQGLDIGGRKDASPDPWYVLDKDLKTNQLIVGQGGQHPRLFASGLICHDINWINQAPSLPYRCKAKARYRQADVDCQIQACDAGFQVLFDQPQRALTPGQFAVFYQGEECLGGGVIERITHRLDTQTAIPESKPSV